MKAPSMSDKETLTAMFKKANIEYEEPETDIQHRIVKGQVIYIERGYTGFYTKFSFDSQGNLENIEAYE